MIPEECKRLAEVDLPTAEASEHAARERSIRHGHPWTLRLGWARRALAPCRAAVPALLWPGLCESHRPAIPRLDPTPHMRMQPHPKADCRRYLQDDHA
ncbi:MAG: hypothetical protein KatS3mg102_0369 [Planctomycetota bacterium]|nr:MAG: hypothetical protein KatS3mg102_0369 [Planctomycetota bacterium]